MTKGNEKHVEREARLRWIPLNKVRVSPLAQREQNPSRIDWLLANFDLEQFGTPTVSERDGHFYIIDGQHRIAALILWLGDGWDEQKVQCWTYTGLTEAEEADKFDRLNDVLAVNAFSKFKVRVTAGRTIESDIQRIVQTQGLVISKAKTPGAIGAVGTLRKVYVRSDAETLGKSLRIIRDAFGDAGFEARVIDGIGHLCQRYNGVLDEASAIEHLSNIHGGVKGLLGKAEVLHKQTGNAKAHCVAAAAVDQINSGRGGKKLPSWWKS